MNQASFERMIFRAEACRTGTKLFAVESACDRGGMDVRDGRQSSLIEGLVAA
jgi:hypothetical protein